MTKIEMMRKLLDTISIIIKEDRIIAEQLFKDAVNSYDSLSPENKNLFKHELEELQAKLEAAAFEEDFDIKTVKKLIDKAGLFANVDKQSAEKVYNNAVMAYNLLPPDKKFLVEEDLKELENYLKS